MTEPAVDIQGLSHQYGEQTALREVSFRVGAGALYGLLGPNGSGKTTLFRVLSTLLRPSRGTARVFGYDVTSDPPPVRQRLGIVFQEPALDDRLTVKENLRFHGALYGLSGAELSERIRSLLLEFGLAERATDRVDALSGGLRRRADLARGLLHRPQLLLLDEPTTGLDPVARRSLWQHLGRLRRKEGTTMLVATHLMDEAERCDEVAILDEGQLVAEGAPHQLKAELGGKTLWLESNEPAALADRLRTQFGLEARRIGDSLQLSHPDAHSLLSSLYEAFGDTIASATVRQPTLEDVFMVHAGYHLDAPSDRPFASREAELR